MNETIKNLIERRSVRVYKPDQITDEELKTIVEAGLYAPSGMGRQPVYIVAVQDKETRDELERINGIFAGGRANTFYGAPTVIVVLYDPDMSPTAPYDGPLVMGNLMNAAHAIGVDSCWIHRAKETFESEDGKALLKKWGLKENLVGVGNCILGYRDCEYPEPKERRADRAIYIK